MSDLIPLLADHPDELEAALLRSAEDDEPERAALENVAASLGVSAGALAATAAGAHAASGSAVMQQLTLGSVVKWLAAGLGAGALASGGAHWLAERVHVPVESSSATVLARPAPQPARPSRARTAEPDASPAPLALAARTPTGASAAPTAAARTAALPTEVGGPRAASPASAGPASISFDPLEDTHAPTPAISAAPASTLGEETKALDSARALILSGRSAPALAALDRYRARFPRGALSAEASLLRIEALLRSGQRPQAEREAETLIARAPQSRHATHARALLGMTPRRANPGE
ncbi:MAG TPA: hypothetical protein VLJ38_22465 [Polyangiaceae bacterium]|nr:hypothetical protein [Polyangiaceae bacterium]